MCFGYIFHKNLVFFNLLNMSSDSEENPNLPDSPATGDESEDFDEDDLYESFDESDDEKDTDTSTIDAQTEVPADIDFKHVIVSICCHPKRNIVASGSIHGPVYLHSYDKQSSNKLISSFDHHKKHCRAVRYSDSGDKLFTGANDATICVLDLETSSIYRKFSRIEGSAIYSLLPIDNFFLASGEDNGTLALWDFRMQTPVECFENCTDFISSLIVSAEKKTLISTSGDATICAYDLRAKKLIGQSEDSDVGFLSAGIVKEGAKLVIGGEDGTINIYNLNNIQNMTDRFRGHPGSVNSIAVLDDDVMCTGCDDGKVRAVQMYPNRILGVLGEHCGLPVEELSLTHDASLLASCSYDQKVRFWDLTGIKDAKSKEVTGKTKNVRSTAEVDSFFSDIM